MKTARFKPCPKRQCIAECVGTVERGRWEEEFVPTVLRLVTVGDNQFEIQEMPKNNSAESWRRFMKKKQPKINLFE